MESGVKGLKQHMRGQAACHANTRDYQHLHYSLHITLLPCSAHKVTKAQFDTEMQYPSFCIE